MMKILINTGQQIMANYGNSIWPAGHSSCLIKCWLLPVGSHYTITVWSTETWLEPRLEHLNFRPTFEVSNICFQLCTIHHYPMLRYRLLLGQGTSGLPVIWPSSNLEMVWPRFLAFLSWEPGVGDWSIQLYGNVPWRTLRFRGHMPLPIISFHIHYINLYHIKTIPLYIILYNIYIYNNSRYIYIYNPNWCWFNPPFLPSQIIPIHGKIS